MTNSGRVASICSTMASTTISARTRSRSLVDAQASRRDARSGGRFLRPRRRAQCPCSWRHRLPSPAAACICPRRDHRPRARRSRGRCRRPTHGSAHRSPGQAWRVVAGNGGERHRFLKVSAADNPAALAGRPDDFLWPAIRFAASGQRPLHRSCTLLQAEQTNCFGPSLLP